MSNSPNDKVNEGRPRNFSRAASDDWTLNDIETLGPKCKTVLVTGGAGFIGSHVADLLMKRGVYFIDNP
jgi:hypothetical protein